MFYNMALYMALFIFGAGLVYKISGWFRFSVQPQHRVKATPAASRFPAVIKGVIATTYSQKRRELVRVFASDVLLQLHICKHDVLRWVMHFLIFSGFMFLFFFHALDKIIFTSLFDPFYLDLNPFIIVAGLMVLTGIAIAIYRRFIRKVERLKTAGPDYTVLILLAVIVISGLTMELTKLTSYENWQIYWNIHVYTCLIGLAVLPFSKMLHVLTTPISLLTNAVMDNYSSPANIKTRQMMELNACTRCGTCSNRCSVAVAFDSTGNKMVLPSERMEFFKDYYSDKTMSTNGLAAIQQGIYLCTNCDRCTVACPAGINLRELWFDIREEIIQNGDAEPLVLTPFSYFRGLNMDKFDFGPFEAPVSKACEKMTAPYVLTHRTDDIIPLTPANQAFTADADLSDQALTYAYCFTCETCTNVCPVVGNYNSPAEELDLLPHQIMRSMGYGIKDLAMGSRMLWYCLTCYQCQENCPQGVSVTDILYELKNLSAREAAQWQTTMKSMQP